MTSFFESIFCCCFSRKPSDESLDDRASLLPSAEDGPSLLSYDATTIDHQTAKERLHVIVKAKEGRMVRVLSRVPFNLRNDPANGLNNTSSSRSNRSPSTNVSHANTRGTDQYGGGNGFDPVSPKYGPSPSVSRSESTSSIQQASNSRISTEDLSDPYAEHKLKVQLVPSTKNHQRAYSRRGRSKTKQGRFSDEAVGMNNVPTLEGIQSVDSDREVLDGPEDRLPGKTSEEAGAASGSGNVDQPQVTPLSDEENTQIKAISKQLSPILNDEFEDIGALTRSWGD